MQRVFMSSDVCSVCDVSPNELRYYRSGGGTETTKSDSNKNENGHKNRDFFFVLLTAVSESFRLMCGTKIGIHMLRSALAAAKQNLIRMF